jgi:hypothetical protein
LLQQLTRPRRLLTRRRALLLGLALLSLWLVYAFILLRPSNERVWEVGMEEPARVTIEGETVVIENVRDLRFRPDGTVQLERFPRRFDTTRIERVWFLDEPFVAAPFTSLRGVAHTYFVFDFEAQEPLALSVEARRERGERFSAWRGLFNQFELIYVWSTEHDATVRRVVHQGNELYMYPLLISDEQAQRLFLQLAQTSQELEAEPRFYNTLTSNCTNELARVANQIRPGTIPNDIALVLPGYSVELLHRLGFIPNQVSVAELRRQHDISDFVREHSHKPEFSALLRQHLAGA